MEGLYERFAIRLDHVVLAAPSLASGARWLTERRGVPLAGGGQHLGWGTHNRLLQLGGGTYLELIAPDPSQPEPQRPRPFGLDSDETRDWIADRPRLVHYVVRTTDIDGTLAALPWPGGSVAMMTRGTLAWRISVGAAFPAPLCVLPTLIQWGTTEHPAATLPAAGTSLRQLRITAIGATLAMLAGLEADPRVRLVHSTSPTGTASLAADLDTPNGIVTLD